MKIIGLIPSRLGSTRLKQKPLIKIGGIPIVIHTYNFMAKILKLFIYFLSLQKN